MKPPSCNSCKISSMPLLCSSLTGFTSWLFQMTVDTICCKKTKQVTLIEVGLVSRWLTTNGATFIQRELDYLYSWELHRIYAIIIPNALYLPCYYYLSYFVFKDFPIPAFAMFILIKSSIFFLPRNFLSTPSLRRVTWAMSLIIPFALLSTTISKLHSDSHR